MFCKKLIGLAICILTIGIANGSQDSTEKDKFCLEEQNVQSVSEFRRRSRFRKISLDDEDAQTIINQLNNENGNLNMNFLQTIANLNRECNQDVREKQENNSVNDKNLLPADNCSDDDEYSMLGFKGKYECKILDEETPQNTAVDGLMNLNKTLEKKRSFASSSIGTDAGSDLSKKSDISFGSPIPSFVPANPKDIEELLMASKIN